MRVVDASGEQVEGEPAAFVVERGLLRQAGVQRV